MTHTYFLPNGMSCDSTRFGAPQIFTNLGDCLEYWSGPLWSGTWAEDRGGLSRGGEAQKVQRQSMARLPGHCGPFLEHQGSYHPSGV